MVLAAKMLSSKEIIQVRIVSDVICPWCWVGKRNLEKAMELSGIPRSMFDIEWHPFQLRPHTPEEGVEKSPNVEERVPPRLKQIGLQVGIEFTGKTDRTPNTLKAHTLLKYALEQSKQRKDGGELQNRLAEALFRMYFTDGKFVGAMDVLKQAAKEVGLDEEEAAKYVNDDENQEQVRREVIQDSKQSISGVPTFFIDGVRAFSGAQPPETFLSFFPSQGPSTTFQ